MSSNLTSFERVKMALEHKEPDKVPFDLGGTILTGMNKNTYTALRKYLGLPEKEIRIIDMFQQLAGIDDDVHEKLKTDVRCVDPGAPVNRGLTKDLTVEGDYCFYTDEYGIGWRMPVKGGHYFDMCKHPLADAASFDEVKNFPWPDPLDPGRFETMKQRADKFVFEDKRAYVLGRNAPGIFEIALWMRGFENFFCDMALDPDFAEGLLDIITEIKIKYWTKALEEVGENVLVISEADDIATQNSLMVSKDMYSKFVAPRHKRLFDHIKKVAKNKVYIFYHSCGAIMEMIPYLIEEGVDILNPVQVSAAGMDTRELKRRFGKDITFWGGGVDTQKILPSGTPQQVKDEVKRRIEDLAPGGGFIFNTVHNVQGDVPPQNYMAMWEAVQEFGKY